MTTIQNETDKAKLETAINQAKYDNAKGSVMDRLMTASREALKIVGDSAAVNAEAFGRLTANQVVAYQSDDDYRRRVGNYLSSREKGVDKKIREDKRTWLEVEFELNKPGKGAKAKDKFKYNNRIQRIESAMKRAVSYTERGIKFEMDGRKVYITASSYRKIVPDHVGTERVEVTTMNEKDTVTWTGLMPAKIKDAANTTDKGTVISATPANLAILCKGVKSATEQADTTKLTGSERIAMLDAFFALQIALGGKEDKALVDAYAALTNDPARKAS